MLLPAMLPLPLLLLPLLLSVAAWHCALITNADPFSAQAGLHGRLLSIWRATHNPQLCASASHSLIRHVARYSVHSRDAREHNLPNPTATTHTHTHTHTRVNTWRTRIAAGCSATPTNKSDQFPRRRRGSTSHRRTAPQRAPTPCRLWRYRGRYTQRLQTL